MKRRLLTLSAILVLGSVTIAGPVGIDLTFNGSGFQLQPFSSDGAFGETVALQSDGKIVVGGTQLVGNNIGDYAAMRLLTSGALDSSFDLDGRVTTNLGPFDISHSLVIQPDGKIVLGGERYSGNTNDDFAAVRYNPNGTLDNSFDFNGIVATNNSGFSDEHSYGMALQADGKLVLVGTTAVDDGAQTDLMIVRYNVDGSLDSTFGGTGILIVSFQNVSESANAVVIQPDDKILIGGHLFNGVKNDFLMIRFTPNGMIDTSFGANGFVISSINASNNSIGTLALQSDGKILAGGSITGGAALVRYNSNGAQDTTFGNGGIALTTQSIGKVVVKPDGRILIGGTLASRFAVLQFGVDGFPDPTFNNGQTATALIPNYQCAGNSLALQNDEKILIGGACFNTSSSQNVMGVARFVETVNKFAYDFDGDGRDDVSVYRNGIWYLLRSQLGFSAVNWGVATDKTVAGDYDGDGKTDTAVFRNGAWIVLNSSNGAVSIVNWGQTGDIPMVGDYDGDDKTDLTVFRGGNWYILQSSNGGFTATGWGLPTDKPVVGKFDADNKSDIAVFRNGNWYILGSLSGFSAVGWGQTGDVPVPGDYDGDGRTDVAVFRGGNWYVLRSTAGFLALGWGLGTDTAVPADYDGDNKTDVAVFRNGNWYILQSSNGAFSAVGFGTTGDKPIPAQLQ